MGRTSLNFICWDLAEGDPELALLYAVWAIRLAEQGLLEGRALSNEKLGEELARMKEAHAL